MKKIRDLVIYHDERFHSAFPSVVLRGDGELICAFRRAPDRRLFGEKESNHIDPNSYQVLVRSHDHGATWSDEPELMFAHPLAGAQEPSMVQLDNGTLVSHSYGWTFTREDADKNPEMLRIRSFQHVVSTGGFVIRSTDGGKTWGGPLVAAPIPGTILLNVFNQPCPAMGRGAMCQTRDGKLHWAVAAHSAPDPLATEVHLLTSEDAGLTWEYACPVAVDEKATFNETSLYETPEGDLVAFLRTANFDDHTVVARSRDGGRSFEPWEDAGWQGHPHHALRLPDDRVFLVYGYRHDPRGVRCRVLNPECTDFASAPEMVLRDEGCNDDLGYPWATMTADGHLLVTYYFNKDDGTRHVAGTLLAIE